MNVLVIIPNWRIVERIALAVPKSFLSTEHIIAFVFGELKREKPIPMKTRLIVKNVLPGVLLKKANKDIPIAVIPIPIEETIRGEILSESQPVKGDSTA